METLINIFNLILYQPLFNALVLFYQYLPGHDFGIAIIVLTFIIRIIFSPLMIQSIKTQRVLSELQPKIQEIRRKYKDDKAKQTQATIELYQKEKINPFAGCLPLLLQMPILIALYRVFWKGLEAGQLSQLYSFVPNPGQINPSFLGIMNLAQPNLILALLAGLSQFFQTRMSISVQKTDVKKDSKIKKQEGMAQFSSLIQKQMLYFFPFFTVLILWKLPSAIGLYWLATTLFSIGQQYLIFKPRSENLTAQ